MNKLFSLLLIITLFSQSIYAFKTWDGQKDEADINKEINMVIDLTVGLFSDCIKDKICKGNKDCQNTMNDSLRCIYKNCITPEFIKSKDQLKMTMCVVNQMAGECNKMSYSQLSALDQCTDVQQKMQKLSKQNQNSEENLVSKPTSSKILALFGLVLSIFFMI